MVVHTRALGSVVLVALTAGCHVHAGSQGRLFSGGGSRVQEEESVESVASRVDIRSSEGDSRRPRLHKPAQQEREFLAEPSDVQLPAGRDIATLSTQDCMQLLERAAVSFEPLPEEAAPTVAMPVYVRTPLYGVSFGPTTGETERGMLDCRLALALYAWGPILRQAGVVKVEHYSTYRPGARVRGQGKSSGHAHALAIDAARFQLDDGRVLDVDLDWDERERGGDPCPLRADESEEGKLLRRVVCSAVERDLFQVVLTPHYDRAHQNHVHLELVPDVDWSYVR